MPETIYLKDGRMADLVTKTDKGYLVDPYCIFKYYEDNEESAPSGNIELVQEIFSEAPKDLIEQECQKLYDRITIISTERDELLKEKAALSAEVASLKRQKTDLAKLTFNRSDIKDAKRIIVFPQNEIAPVIYDPPNRHKLSLSIEINDYDPKIRAWIYRFYGDGSYGSGDYFDEKYGIKCDLSDDEVMALHFERLASRKFEDWVIKRTPDKWLTQELVDKKNQLIKQDKTVERTKKEFELAEIQKWLANN